MASMITLDRMAGVAAGRLGMFVVLTGMSWTASMSQEIAPPTGTQAEESNGDAQAEKGLPEFLTLEPLEAKPDDSELRKLQVARYNAAAAELAARRAILHAGSPPLAGYDGPALMESARRLHKARLALAAEASQRIRAHEQYVEFLKSWEDTVEDLVENGRTSTVELHLARYRRLDAEIDLLREKNKATSVENAGDQP